MAPMQKAGQALKKTFLLVSKLHLEQGEKAE
jgi:hypothetical protein